MLFYLNFGNQKILFKVMYTLKVAQIHKYKRNFSLSYIDKLMHDLLSGSVKFVIRWTFVLPSMCNTLVLFAFTFGKVTIGISIVKALCVSYGAKKFPQKLNNKHYQMKTEMMRRYPKFTGCDWLCLIVTGINKLTKLKSGLCLFFNHYPSNNMFNCWHLGIICL